MLSASEIYTTSSYFWKPASQRHHRLATHQQKQRLLSFFRISSCVYVVPQCLLSLWCSEEEHRNGTWVDQSGIGYWGAKEGTGALVWACVLRGVAGTLFDSASATCCRQKIVNRK